MKELYLTFHIKARKDKFAVLILVDMGLENLINKPVSPALKRRDK
jgi:hypothetical protein